MNRNRHQSFSPRNSGFVNLGSGPGGDSMNDGSIPLTTVRSNASTGRRPNVTNPTSFDNDSNNSNEKGGHQHHLHRGRRRKLEDQQIGRRGTGSEEGGRLNFMGRMYAHIVGFSVVTRYLVYIIPVAIVLAVPLIVLGVTGHKDKNGNGNPIYIGRNKNGKPGPTLFNLFLWIEITWLSCWVAKVVAWIIPKVFLFFSGIVSAGTRKYATVLKNLTITLSVFFWALATWLTFKNLFNQARNDGISWCKDLERVLGALFVSSAILLVEKAIIQLIGVSYHQRSFALRISASKREIHLLGMLYDASRTLFPMYCQEFEEEDVVIDDSIDMLLRPKGKSGSATPMKVIGDVARVGDKVTSAFGNIASEITGKKVFNVNAAHSIVLGALEKLGPSEALARRIWMSFCVEGKDSLYLEDFQEVLGPAYKAEAEEAFNAIDSDLNGDVSLDEMVRKVVEMGKERKAIGEGMKDIGQALKALDRILLFVVLLIVVFVFLAFFQSSFVTIIASAGTTVLSLSFIFAVTAQEFLGSCIFLFVKHPYDVGDRVDISDSKMTVERISLLYTAFVRNDTAQIVQIPNIILNSLWVDNISRSKAMVESLQVNVSFDTTFEDIELLRAEMEQFVRSPDNSRDFQRDFNIGCGGVGNLDMLVLNISIKHKSNWHNDSVRATRRSKFMCALALALKKIPINGPGGGGEALGGPTNPAYSVAVTDDFASNSRDAAAKAKAASRMVPPPADQTEEEAREAEEAAISGINTRPVVAETAGMWDAPDDRTIGSLSREASREDRQRSRDVDSMRSELYKSQSQRGRRRAGEGLPSLSTTDSHPGGAPSQHAPSPRLETFDEEAATGMPSSFYSRNRSATASGGASGHLAPGGQSGLRPSASVRSQRSGNLHPSQH